jgi:exopolyphosphatase/guanosine-5'-triphosphate,3'-diphosphate pyrophosphatase
VGGGSAELVVGTRAGVLASTSLPLGALRLAARFPEDALDALARHVTARMPDGHTGRDPRGARPIGVGGTITTLGALDLRLSPYDGRRLLGHVLTRDRIAELRAELADRPLRDRERDPILERGRADVIVHGAVVYECILDRHGWDEIEISPRGLREGLLAEMLGVVAGGAS